ncbi:MAG: ABC transporter ATP-binding protein [Pseudomonadota bacterium]
MPCLRLIDVDKSYKGEKILDRFNLQVNDGETLVIFGPSGGGKTVLLRMISGMIEPDAGRIMRDDDDITDLEPQYRNMGMAFQNFALFPHMTAFENIASPLRAHKKTNQEITTAVLSIAALLKIDHVLSHLPRALSNGQKQRTALARALVNAPSLLLLDDPLRNVDAKLRFEMRLELPRLLAQQGTTVIYVTQDYKEAMALADRIAVVRDGHIIQLANPQEIYHTPADVEVARLFGDPPINLFEIVPRKDNKTTLIDLAGHTIELKKAKAGLDRPCLLGLRPEVLSLAKKDTPRAIPITIEAKTPLNEKTVILAVTEQGQELLISRPSQEPDQVNERAYLTFEPEQALLFDQASGENLQNNLHQESSS